MQEFVYLRLLVYHYSLFLSVVMFLFFSGGYGILPSMFYVQANKCNYSRKETLLAGTIETDPSENSNWRKHKNACPFYRERWFPCNDVSGEPMYQVFCLKNTPPVTAEEQEKCFRSKTKCWRLTERKQSAAAESASTPEEASTSFR